MPGRGGLAADEALIFLLGQDNRSGLVSFDDVHGATPQTFLDGRHATTLELSNGQKIVHGPGDST